MALGRIVELLIGENAQGLKISNLDIEFDIEKSRTLADNNAEFTIYNAKQSTRNDILKKGNNLIFNFGYKDETTATIFIGNIIDSYSEKINADWVTKIKASTVRAKDQALEIIPISLSYGQNTPIAEPIKYIAAASGLAISGIENINGLKLINGWVYAGTFKGALRYLKSVLDATSYSMYIDNNEIVIYKTNTASRFTVSVLSYTGGLRSIRPISKVEEQKKRVEFTSLIIPKIRIDSLIKVVNTSSDDGVYIVDKLKIAGSNFDNECKMVGEATA